MPLLYLWFPSASKLYVSETIDPLASSLPPIILAKSFLTEKAVMHEVIDGNQYAFIKGRNIVGSILVANESMEDYSKGSKKEWLWNWTWRKPTTKQIGISSTILWLGRASVLFGGNGCIVVSLQVISLLLFMDPLFLASRDLRHGDPLSPFLFLLVADSLSQTSLRPNWRGCSKAFW